MTDKKYPYWVIKTTAGPYLKHTLNMGAFMAGTYETTDKISEAEKFGRDFGKQVADKWKLKLVKVTGSKPKAPPPPELVNHVAIVLDSSGSMGVIRDATVRALNETIKAIGDASKQHGQRTTVSMWTFGVDNIPSYSGYRNVSGTLNYQVREDFFQRDVTTLRPLETHEYRPHGNTPMLDAIGQSITRLRESTGGRANPPNVSYLVYLITDGEENASTKYTADWVAGAIDDSQKTDRWSFVFLVPPGKKEALCRRFKIHEGNVREWERTTAGVQQYTQAVTRGVSLFYAARAAGETATKGFFTTDLSGVSPTEIRRQLTDVRNKFTQHKVDKEGEIEVFIQEQTGQSYRKGDAYVELSKDEKLPSYKRILVREKGQTAVYAGDEARKLLGLPSTDCKVRVGNHANYTLFFQSHSTNRKLVRGTTVLYLKPGETL